MKNKALTDPKFRKCLTEAQDRLMSIGKFPIGPTSKDFGKLANEIAENLYKKLK